MPYFLPDERLDPVAYTERGAGKLPGHLGIVITRMQRDVMEGHFDIVEAHHAPNGFLHAGSVVTLADTLSGYGTVANLPEGATGFTTIELKSNFFATALQGRVHGRATPVHVGGATQVWDCEVTHADTGKRMALFRCTQMVLRKKG
jgi:1,4-dihydroxy-2-naphthoyl-CoA hydrolase